MYTWRKQTREACQLFPDHGSDLERLSSAPTGSKSIGSEPLIPRALLPVNRVRVVHFFDVLTLEGSVAARVSNPVGFFKLSMGSVSMGSESLITIGPLSPLQRRECCMHYGLIRSCQ